VDDAVHADAVDAADGSAGAVPDNTIPDQQGEHATTGDRPVEAPIQHEPAKASATIPDDSIDPDTPLFKVRSFTLLFITRVASTTAFQMISVVVGWHVYEITNSALHLGLIGLAQFLAPALFMIPAGQIVDRYNRRLVLRIAYSVAFVSALGLTLVATAPTPNLPAIYGLVFLNMTARTFEQPLMQALLPIMAPRPILNRAIAAHVSARHLSVLIGPSVGGVLYVFGPVFDYSVCTTLVLAAMVAAFLLPDTKTPGKKEDVSLDSVLAGFRFIWCNQAILGAMLFEFMAAMFGSVNALLPIYARDILQIGAWGVGVLRSAPAAGALLAAAVLSRFPLTHSGGPLLFGSFAMMGVAGIFFGLSQNLVFSIAALFVMGLGDMVSTVIRQTLIQTATPDEMRGRVFAVNSLFYGTAGQLGAFRAGVMAEYIGAIGAVVFGGGVLIGAVGLWTWLFPALRRLDRPDGLPSERDAR
jgi:MFS family permease